MPPFDEPPIAPLSGWRAAALIAGVAALVFALSREPASRQPLGEAAPELSLPGLDGKTVALADFKGKVVLLDFWATWCGPCVEELPDLKAVHAKFKDRGFTVLGVSMDGADKESIAAFVKKNQVSYPIALANGDTPKGYDIPGLPSAFLVDAKGRIVRKYLGPRSADEFSRDVEAVLGN